MTIVGAKLVTMRLFWTWSAALAAASAADRYAAMPMRPDGLMGRFYIDKSFPMAKRATSCGSDEHDCQDVKHPDQCCNNDSYCYVNTDFEARCCPIGSNCSGDSSCSSEAYYCTTTITKSATATVETGCCGRACPATSQFQCAPSQGGKCCPYGAECQSGGQCISTVTPPATTAASSVPPGCTTSQFKCQDGPGCCDNWQHCTSVSGTGYCAAGNPTNTAFSIVPVASSGDSLSTGAKAGIAVGVIIGAGILIGAVTWFILAQRKKRRRALANQSASGGAPAASTDEAAMTEVGAGPRPRQGVGLTQDYFGPDAVPGPYSERAGQELDKASPMPGRAVPSSPHAPGDIAAPVEIDSVHKPDGSERMSPTSFHQSPQDETIQSRFELYGSEAVPQHPQTPSELPTPHSPRSEGPRPPEA